MALERIYIRGFIMCALATSIGVAFGEAAYAERFTSPNYQIDASVAGNSFGGEGSSSSYKLVSSGGESIIGSGAGGSYKLAEGYVAQIEPDAAPNLQLTVQTANLSVGTVTPGVSEQADFEVETLTNQTDYQLAINQDHDLQSGAATIPAVSGSIASPLSWSEGSTKGFGFSLVSAAGLPGKWDSGSSYAAIPGSSSVFYTRSGNTPNVSDSVMMRFRVDVNNSQVTGSYSNDVTITGTSIP